MAHTTSALRTKLTTEAQNNEGLPWSTLEAAVELLLPGGGVSGPSLIRNPSQGLTKAAIKNSAGSLYGYNFINSNTYAVYAKFYDALVASVTVGSTVPTRTILIPAAGSWNQEPLSSPITAFNTGIVIAVTKLADDTDATALDNAILAEVFFK